MIYCRQAGLLVYSPTFHISPRLAGCELPPEKSERILQNPYQELWDYMLNRFNVLGGQ